MKPTKSRSEEIVALEKRIFDECDRRIKLKQEEEGKRYMEIIGKHVKK